MVAAVLMVDLLEWQALGLAGWEIVCFDVDRTSFNKLYLVFNFT
jgi:hypothetical protein